MITPNLLTKNPCFAGKSLPGSGVCVCVSSMDLIETVGQERHAMLDMMLACRLHMLTQGLLPPAATSSGLQAAALPPPLA